MGSLTKTLVTAWILTNGLGAQPAYRDVVIQTDPPGAEVWLSQVDQEKNTGQTTNKPVRIERSWFFDAAQNPVGRTLIFRLAGHEDAKARLNWGQINTSLTQDGKPFRLAPLKFYYYALDHLFLSCGILLGVVAGGAGLGWQRHKTRAAQSQADAQRQAAEAAQFKAMQEQARQQAEREKALQAQRQAQEEARKAKEQQDLLAAKHQTIQDAGGKDPWIGIEFTSQRIGTYRPSVLLGVGGMGAVYEAVLVKGKPISPVKIALKIVDLRSKPGAKERAISEGQVGMQIVHPSIVRCLDYVELPEAICLFQELVDGKQSLQSQVKPGGMDPGLAVELLLPVASGLLTMHSKGYIHRDIKPENIMLNVDGQLKIADLGLAKNPHAGFQTDSRDFLGTFAYCAPEQITNTSKVTAQADQYALGCVLYELIEGRLPFLGPDYLQFAAAHLNDIPPPARKLTVQANVALLKMLEKDPANRYEDPLMALQALQDSL